MIIFIIMRNNGIQLYIYSLIALGFMSLVFVVAWLIELAVMNTRIFILSDVTNI
jgi:hypothetical protein